MSAAPTPKPLELVGQRRMNFILDRTGVTPPIPIPVVGAAPVIVTDVKTTVFPSPD